MIKQVIRAKVLKTDYKKGTCKVRYEGRNDVIDDIQVLCRFNESSALPKKGSQVLVLMDGEGRGEGYILGQFFNGSGHKPHKGTSKDKMYLTFNNLELTAKDIVINCKNLTVNADSITFKTKGGVKTL